MKPEIEIININDLKVNEKNARTFSDKNKQELKASMENYNLTEPLFINTKNNRVISGHQRLAMMKELNKIDNKFNELYLIKKGDYGYVMDKQDSKILNDEQELSIGLTSNKIDGSWNYEALEDLFSTELNNTDFFTAFDEDEINTLLKDLEEDVEIMNNEVEKGLNIIKDNSPVFDLFEEEEDSEPNIQIQEPPKQVKPIKSNIKTLNPQVKKDITVQEPPKIQINEDLLDEEETNYNPNYIFDNIEETNKTYYLEEGEEWKIGEHTLKVGKLTNTKITITIDYNDLKITFRKRKSDKIDPVTEFEEQNKNNKGLKI